MDYLLETFFAIMSIRKLIRETLENHLNEIDWSKAFSDVKGTCLSPVAVVKWLNDELARIDYNKANPQGDRIKRGKKDIIVTRGTIEDVMDEKGTININQFIKNITAEPDSIFDHNPKMEKSDVGRPQVTMNTGLPAIVGIVYDLENKKFYSVSTCPGAGACQLGCYARKAFYGMDNSKTMKLTRRLNLLFNDPEGYKARILSEIEPMAKNLKTSSIGMPQKMQLVLRWNDAGDFFGDMYFNIAVEVTKELIDKGYNVKSYAYTKNSKYLIAMDKNKNFVVTFSSDATPKELRSVQDYDVKGQVKMAENVPKDLFSDIFIKEHSSYKKGYNGLPLFANEQAPEILKRRIYDAYKDKYKIKKGSLKYTFELPSQEGGKNEYNLIVLPTGDSDIGAQRKDVQISFLLQH